jgi:hypothetical protein
MEAILDFKFTEVKQLYEGPSNDHSCVQFGLNYIFISDKPL